MTVITTGWVDTFARAAFISGVSIIFFISAINSGFFIVSSTCGETFNKTGRAKWGVKKKKKRLDALAGQNQPQ